MIARLRDWFVARWTWVTKNWRTSLAVLGLLGHLVWLLQVGSPAVQKAGGVVFLLALAYAGLSQADASRVEQLAAALAALGLGKVQVKQVVGGDPTAVVQAFQRDLERALPAKDTGVLSNAPQGATGPAPAGETESGS